MHSLRLVSGDEALVARALNSDGRMGFGFSLSLDATRARHMAEWHAGTRAERPAPEPTPGHPWEKAYSAGQPVDWNIEPGFAKIRWLP